MSTRAHITIVVLAVAVAVTLIAATTTMLVNLLRGPETFTVSGTFTLSDIDGIFAGADRYGFEKTAVNGAQCLGEGGYDDISPGALVTVYDSSATVLGVGSLDLGTSTWTAGA